jgi:hypothetical protein
MNPRRRQHALSLAVIERRNAPERAVSGRIEESAGLSASNLP